MRRVVTVQLIPLPIRSSTEAPLPPTTSAIWKSDGRNMQTVLVCEITVASNDEDKNRGGRIVSQMPTRRDLEAVSVKDRAEVTGFSRVCRDMPESS